MRKYYAGIGSRSAPEAICEKMTNIASKLAVEGYTLRSGGSLGADTAFAKGCSDKQIFLPWDHFNVQRMTYAIMPEAYGIAKEHHPNWNNLTEGAKKMMARNAMQILGPDLNEPVQFVLCWTPDGCSTKEERTYNTGGTGQAIAHAHSLNIPIFNIAKNAHYLKFHQFFNSMRTF